MLETQLQLKDLHASGYSLLSIDAQGQTALHWAARHGHRDVIKYLLASSPSALLDMVDNEKSDFFLLIYSTLITYEEVSLYVMFNLFCFLCPIY